MGRNCQWKDGCGKPGGVVVCLRVNHASYVCADHHRALEALVDQVKLEVLA